MLRLLLMVGVIIGPSVAGVVTAGLRADDGAHAAADHSADNHVAGDHSSGAESHGGGHGGGLPGFRSDLSLFSLITFVIFLFVLKSLAWEPLRTGLDQREGKIRQEIAAAEAGRVQSAALLKQYEDRLAQAQQEVKELLAEARRDAEHTKEEILSMARQEADQTRTRALEDIEQARRTAIADVFETLASNVIQATERVIRKSVSPDDHERLVREALAEVDVRRN
jgi:F-type H+-transporting ATPase subunit b